MSSQEPRKPLAIGQAKEATLLKLLPPKNVQLILTWYIKKKTGEAPHRVDTFSGLIMECKAGKIFFKDGILDFEPNPFMVKKVKTWPSEIRNILKSYAGTVFVKSAEKVLKETYKLVREQELEKGGMVLEIEVPDAEGYLFQVAILPSGRVMVFSNQNDDTAQQSALQIVKSLEKSNLVDF